jgi:3-isopropylmalate/(R)-2-methylmalate dehydratase small subunit
MTIRGNAFRYGDNIDTDVIIPARYLNSIDPAELAAHCLEDLDPGFIKRVKPGDLIVAGRNFGCGSSREHAPLAIKAAGVSCVIAAGFARIFYRNAINIGLPILECPDAAAGIETGQRVSVDFDSGEIVNEATGRRFRAAPFPPFMRELIARGGLVSYVQAKLAGRGAG